MKRASRRDFLKSSLAGAGAVSFGLLALSQAGCQRKFGEVDSPLGPLQPVADENTGLPLLWLPQGFRYRTIAWAGDPMSDGLICPNRFDGMGIVSQTDTEIRMIRNHEARGSSGAIGPPEHSYDVTGGGTVTLVFDREREIMTESWVSLSGTLNNCAGGITPWGTWLSCEEAALRANPNPPSHRTHWNVENAGKSHGYVFEVPASGIADPKPLKAMGQFEHEAAAVDPQTGVVYMTEDLRPNAGFYRFLPAVKERLSEGGRLQMMSVKGGLPMQTGLALGEDWPVTWVDIDDPEMGLEEGEDVARGVVNQGLKNGGSAFISLEGAIWDQDKLYFTSKRGGGAGAGYIFEYTPSSETVRLVYESPGHKTLSGPDNIDVSPRGNLVICEDRVSGGTIGQCLAGISKAGELHKFSLVNPNLDGSWNDFDLRDTARESEWAGVCFSADGQWMFANLQKPGITFAITGPWLDDWM